MFNWHTYPFVRLVIPLIIGIVFARLFDISETIFFATSIFCIALSVCLVALHFKHTTPLKTFFYGSALSFLLIGTGIILTYLNDETHRADYFGKINMESAQIFVGSIADITPTTTNMRLNIETSGILMQGDSTQKMKNVSGNLLVYTAKDSISAFHVGQTVTINAKPNRITSLRNPFEFDFAQYWHSKNVHYQCFANADALHVLDSTPTKNIRSLSITLQTELSSWLLPYLQTPNETYVGTALMLGAKNYEAEEIKTAYIQTGAMHILAVSGMHVMLLWLALKRIVSLFIKNRKTKTIIGTGAGLVAIWLFACVTGLGASVLRATVMATFLGLGELANRKANAVNMLAASSFLLLLIDPNMLFDIGFQFSYLAVLSIVVWYPYIFNWFHFKNRAVHFLWEITALGFAAQILVTPLSLFYFHRFATYFWLTGLLAIPVSTVALYAGLLVFIFHSIPPLAWCAGKVFSFSVWLMNAIILKTDELPFGAINGVYLTALSVVLLYILIYCVFSGVYKKTLRAWQPALVSILILASLSAFKFQTKPTRTVCIYNNASKKTLIDIFSENACLTITNIDTSNVRQVKQIDHATHNFREFKKVLALKTIGLNDSDAINKIGFTNHVIFGTPERWLIISGSIAHFSNLPIENIVLANNVDVSIDSIQKYFSPKKIILDASNKSEISQTYVKDCQRLNLAVHDVKTQGAYWMDY